MLNKERGLQLEFSRRVLWETVPKQQPPPCSSLPLSPFSILQAASPARDQSCYNTAARIRLWCCPHCNAVCSARTTGSGSTTDQGAMGKV